jgi:hypothetical protein
VIYKEGGKTGRGGRAWDVTCTYGKLDSPRRDSRARGRKGEKKERKEENGSRAVNHSEVN